jgi:DNA repair exonuclease SbcCD nuclease subunit
LKNLRFLFWLCMIFIAASCSKALLGDHTKDGELINHESVKDLLQQLADAGIKVFVVPGNHDINIETRHVTSIDATLPGGMDFLSYSNLFTSKTEEFLWNDVNTLKIRNKPLAI